MSAIEITFGALSPFLHTQLKNQGFVFRQIELEHLQCDADSITRLAVRGLISNSAATKARKRLLKNIVAWVESKGHRERN